MGKLAGAVDPPMHVPKKGVPFVSRELLTQITFNKARVACALVLLVLPMSIRTGNECP